MDKKEMFAIKIKEMANDVSMKASVAVKKSSETVEKTKEEVFKSVDANGDGQIDIEDVVLMAFRVPGVSVNREKFLRKELSTKYDVSVVEEAIISSPMRANISRNDLDSVAMSIIQNERLKVSGISVALGTPGGAAMAATIPADIAQYYGCMLRVAQKLLYLYGFPQIEFREEEQNFDTETMNQIILCMGVMFGVANAKNGLLAIAKALGTGVEKQLVKKAIPLVGGVVGGGLTYATFKPCCDKLKEVLQDTYLSNPNYKDNCEEVIDIECDIEFDTNEEAKE